MSNYNRVFFYKSFFNVSNFLNKQILMLSFVSQTSNKGWQCSDATRLAKHLQWRTNEIKVRIEYDNHCFPSITSETFMSSAIKIKWNKNLRRNIVYQWAYYELRMLCSEKRQNYEKGRRNEQKVYCIKCLRFILIFASLFVLCTRQN